MPTIKIILLHTFTLVSKDELHFIITFGLKLKALREKRNLTQAELASDIDCEISQISRIERGKINTSLTMLFKIAKSLDIEISALMP